MSREDWENMAASVRIALEKRIPQMATMTPKELDQFTRAAINAEVFELNAECHDERVGDFKNRLSKPWKDD